MSRLSVGVVLPAWRTAASDVRACARHAEDLGLDALFTGDHLAAAGPTLDSSPLTPITGPPAQAAERFWQYAEAGASHLILGVIGDDWRHQCELIARTRELAG